LFPFGFDRSVDELVSKRKGSGVMASAGATQPDDDRAELVGGAAMTRLSDSVE
jgi:hypothetical protein